MAMSITLEKSDVVACHGQSRGQGETPSVDLLDFATVFTDIKLTAGMRRFVTLIAAISDSLKF
jgi:hypothetical protein